jgi:hypothetical protein
MLCEVTGRWFRYSQQVGLKELKPVDQSLHRRILSKPSCWEDVVSTSSFHFFQRVIRLAILDRDLICAVYTAGVIHTSKELGTRVAETRYVGWEILGDYPDEERPLAVASCSELPSQSQEEEYPV